MRGLGDMPSRLIRCPWTAVAAVLVLLGQHASNAAPAVADCEQIFTDAVGGLVRRAEAAGSPRLATAIRAWQLPDPGDRQCVFAIPPAREDAPEWIDTPAGRAIWEDFLAARAARADATFKLAVTAVAPERESGETRPCEALALLYRALRDDPDHERAREAGGWVRRDGRWVWPETARRIDKREEHSPEFGWLPHGRQDRYRAGDRYESGRWFKADAGYGKTAAGRGPPGAARPVGQARKFFSDHWSIASTAGMESTADLARRLEEAHTVWMQVFGGFQYEPAEWRQRLQGRGRPRAADPFAATLAADRQEYVAALEHLEPQIGRTLGIYWSPTRTAWFFEGAGQEPTTVHHEATHQLFAEKRRTSPLAGERCGFWAIEAAACYLESVVPTEFGWTVGGRDAGRAPAARERLVDDGFHVPLGELAALGRHAFQADERLPRIYSEISGLADFFMNGQGRRYREAFVEYLVRVYTGTVDADTLSRLCKRSYAALDDEYRHHMAR